ATTTSRGNATRTSAGRIYSTVVRWSARPFDGCG
ncbi:uncharacterized protein METZ01_LOCUS478644, partial [marine metagenome]